MIKIETSEIFDEITSRIPLTEEGENQLTEVLVQLDQMTVINDLKLEGED